MATLVPPIKCQGIKTKLVPTLQKVVPTNMKVVGSSRFVGRRWCRGPNARF